MYCNYSKGKFGSQLKFVIPSWTELYPFDEMEERKIYDAIPKDDITANQVGWVEHSLDGYIDHFNLSDRIFIRSLQGAEKDYLQLIKEGWKPEQVAEVLPQCTAADVVMSGYDSDWKFVFSLRSDETTGKVHPLVLELMKPLHEEFKNKKWIQ